MMSALREETRGYHRGLGVQNHVLQSLEDGGS